MARPASGHPPDTEVEVRRSARRRRSVSAYRDGGKIIVLVPARLSKTDEQRLVADMVERIGRREARATTGGAKSSDAALSARARQLSAAHLDGRAQPASVRWVSNMTQRWGSCTTIDATIRVSDRLRAYPHWVLDYVLVHELAHLLQPGHGPEFWALTARYAHTDRARGFLDGISFASGHPVADDQDGEPDSGSSDLFDSDAG